MGSRGLTVQRNAGSATLSPDTDVVVFFDDDALPRDDFLERAAAHLVQHPECVALTGRVAMNGAALKRELSSDEMVESLRSSWSGDNGTFELVSVLYGCNMVIRYGALMATLFDERLPLYSYLEADPSPHLTQMTP